MMLIITGTVYPVSDIFASENTSEILDSEEESEPSEVRELRTAEDLILLSEKSKDESYTKNVRYILKNDIDLTGTDFSPISIFAGEFFGEGHKISGFIFTDRLDKAGFIRTVTGSGHITDLKISGVVEPTGDMSETGGITAVNYGLIEKCSFEGYLLAFEIAGGIAGHNMESGVIKNCVNLAEINATRRTGGISGFNEGLIDSSENRGSINASKKTAHEMDESRVSEDDGDEENTIDKLIPDSIDFKDENLFEKYDNGLKINYTGGIAGVCSGTILDSENSGTVGYPHVGYKTGGITGYDRGIISGCRNTGKIFGRKDTGGIAGQFEPYAVNAYSEDALSRTGDSLNELSERFEKFHKDFGVQDDKTQANIDAVRASSDELRDLIKFYKEYYRCKDDSVEREIKEKVDKIRSVTDSINLRRFDGETKDALQTFIDNSDDIEKLIDAAIAARQAGVLPDMVKFLEQLSDISRAGKEAADMLMTKAIRVSKDGRGMKEDLEDLRDATNELDDYLRGCVDDYKKDFRITSDDIQAHTDHMADEMDVLSDGLKYSDGEIRKDLDSMVSSLNSLNDGISDSYKEIQTELQKIYDTDEKKDIFDDLSDDDDTELKKGVLLSSDNDGDIAGDINCGGIAGIITEDSDTQSDFEVVSSGQVSLNYDRYEKATIINCRNNGEVTVRNDCAGGIVGRADLGAVINSHNYGRIESTEGDYAGGIAGRSAFVVRNCYSMCEAISGKYAGGITGLGHSLINNVCLSTVDPDMEYHGAVAGDTDNADLDNKDKGKVSGNTFVYKGLGAINGVTNDGESKAVSYGELLHTEGLPSDFGRMTVTFKNDGKTVKKIRVPYGRSIDSADFPEIRENLNGQFGYWEETDLSEIRQNMTVNAVYVDYIKSVASDRNVKPGLILNGRFYEGTTVNYSTKDHSTELPDGNEIIREVTFTVSNEFGIPENKSYTVRYMAEGCAPEDIVLLQSGDSYTAPALRRDGDYMVFDMPDEGSFYIARTREKKIRSVAPFAAAGVILIFIIIMTVSGLKKRKKDLKDGRKQE